MKFLLFELAKIALYLAGFALSVVYLLWVLETSERNHIDPTLFFVATSAVPWIVALVGFWSYSLYRHLAGKSV